MKRRTALTILSSIPFTLKSVLAKEKYTHRSIIWIWLGGGPSQFETFGVDITGRDEYAPVNGFIYSTNGVSLGGDWTSLSTVNDKIVTVNNFGHGDSSHLQATHQMISGYYNSDRTTTAHSKKPSIGSIVCNVNGNFSQNGVPTYVRQNKIDGDEAAWLGNQCEPFDVSKKDNLKIKLELDRFTERHNLLKKMEGNFSPWFNTVEQAYKTSVGDALLAFDTSKESEKDRLRYGSGIGEQLLLARRLSRFGSQVVNIHYGGWDMHSGISAITNRVKPLDSALTELIKDIQDQHPTMIVVTGEFGRTRLNGTAGRDHWPQITPLLLASNVHPMGRGIGKNDKSYTPTEGKTGPQDLMATIFDFFSIPHNIQRVNNGRPTYLLEQGKNIL